MESVRLTEEEWSKARKFGSKRYNWQRFTPDAGHIAGVNYRISGVHYETIAVAAEFAVVKYLGLDPNACGWCKFSTNPQDYKQPDIMNIIDVRTVTSPGNGLMVKPKDVQANAVIAVAHVPSAFVVDGDLQHDSTVSLLGWETAATAWEEGMKMRGGAKRYYEPLQPMRTLHTVLAGVAA